MRPARPRRLERCRPESRRLGRCRRTWSRLGTAACVALIVTGAVVAVGPEHRGALPPPVPLRKGMASDRLSGQGAQARAAQQVAVAFVVACDTTDRAQPAGDLATQTTLAPTLVLSHALGPALWGTENRATTVALDPPGQPIERGGDEVAVVVTGIMTVTTDAGPRASVPLVERITLRPVANGHAAGEGAGGPRAVANGGASRWQVSGVEVGA